jgi:hypothetical protein
LSPAAILGSRPGEEQSQAIKENQAAHYHWSRDAWGVQVLRVHRALPPYGFRAGGISPAVRLTQIGPGIWSANAAALITRQT